MSTLIIKIEPIKEVSPLENSDNLQVVRVFDWEVVARKGQFQIGDQVIYLPPDTVLSDEFNAKLFPPESKIKLHKNRIRAIRIRGKISQGMILNPKEFDLAYVIANVSKYEPPASEMPNHMNIQRKKNKPDLKAFIKYTDIENGRYYDRVIQDNEECYISTKLHGTSSRYGWFKSEANVWWQKVFKFLHLLPEWTFAWGSRNVQIQAKLLKRHQGCTHEGQGVEFGDVYTKMVTQYNLQDRIPKGYAIYGEICGVGIQGNYSYGCKNDEHRLYLYDIYDVGAHRWLDYDEFKAMVDKLNENPQGYPLIDRVPEMYVGPYSRAVIEKYLPINPISKEVNEGVVAKPTTERLSPTIGRVVLKFINPAYLLVKTTENH